MTHREINEQQRVLQFKAIGVRLENLAAARETLKAERYGDLVAKTEARMKEITEGMSADQVQMCLTLAATPVKFQNIIKNILDDKTND